MKKIILSIVFALSGLAGFGQIDSSDKYAGKDSVSWNGETWMVKETSDFYILRPPRSKYNYDEMRFLKNGEVVPYWSVSRRMPNYKSVCEIPHSSAQQVFYTMLKGVDLKGEKFKVSMWVDTKTGKVEDVAIYFEKNTIYSTLDIEYFIRIAWRIKAWTVFDLKGLPYPPEVNCYTVLQPITM